MSDYDPTVFIVDDDPSLRDSLKWLLESVRLKVMAFDSGQDFLARYPRGERGCILLDVRMPGGGGLNALAAFQTQGIDLPVVFITGHADVSLCVQAFRGGASDFIEKPFHDQMLLDSVQRALDKDRTSFETLRYSQRIAARVAELTPREADIFRPLVEGRSTREIAELLELSPKTVEAYRLRVMKRMQADNLSALVRMAITAGGLPLEVEESGDAPSPAPARSV